ncbi:hypothetical protein HAX54_002672 [Datura stramonium]|uniref:Josephin-like protein n=1 Tax=Datura stramonium TaxID=4076 RepID=A0ABS8WRH5_DATST|nr:hypothetical protein [Datura stramonium]
MLAKKGSNNKRAAHHDDQATNSTKSGYSFIKRSSSELSAIKMFKRLGGKMVAIVRMMSPRSSSRKANSKPSDPSTMNSRSDHRVEAIKDCINFINSSSARLPRSNSVTS